MIECENIDLSFEGLTIFQNFSLTIGKGDKVGISGPSGKGKTSLMKMLAGLLVPDSGKIRINNELLGPDTVNTIRKEIAWLPQNIDLPVDSGYELAKLLDPDFRGEKVLENFLEQLGLLPGMLHKSFTQVSGGQKQRIILAVCLNLNKSILMLDEPTSALDTESVEKLIATLSEMKELTVVSISHNERWLQSCDKIVNL